MDDQICNPIWLGTVESILMEPEHFIIRSTEELPAKFDGEKATIVKKDFLNHKGFHVVLAWKSGVECIVHESQLERL